MAARRLGGKPKRHPNNDGLRFASVPDRAASEWSDLDVVFTTTARNRYQTTTDWIYEIGNVWVAFADRGGKPRHGVVFSGGINADFVVLRHGGRRVVPRVLRARRDGRGYPGSCRE